MIDINELTIKISRSVLARQFLETRHRTVEDDGLIGLLNLLTNLLKHRPPFQTSKQGQELLCEVKALACRFISLCVVYICRCFCCRFSIFCSPCQIQGWGTCPNANLRDLERPRSICWWSWWKGRLKTMPFYMRSCSNNTSQVISYVRNIFCGNAVMPSGWNFASLVCMYDDA